MSIKRIDRVNELLRREIGECLFQVLDGDNVNLGAITISHVVTSVNLRHARVLVSVLGDLEEQKHALTAIRRKRVRIQEHIARDMTLKYTPRLNFELDGSIAQGDHVLSVLDELAGDNVYDGPGPDPETDLSTTQPDKN